MYRLIRKDGDNMEFVYGLLTAVVFFIALLFSFYLGTRYGSKKTTVTADEEEQRKARKHREELKALFTYDVNKALERKKVT